MLKIVPFSLFRMRPLRATLLFAVLLFGISLAGISLTTLAGCARADVPVFGSSDPNEPCPNEPCPYGVGGTAPISATASRDASGEVPLERMIGQMLLVGFRGLGVAPGSFVERAVASGRVGGVILFNRDVALKSDVRNIQSPAQVRALTRRLASIAPAGSGPLLVAVDQEGGRVLRMGPDAGFAPAPSHQELGRIDDPVVTEAVGHSIGATLASVGVNVDFAPVADVNVNPDNPVIGRLGRSFSADPAKVAVHAAAFARGLGRSGVLACLKHFPGHGSAWNDSHQGLCDVTDTWTMAELEPYRRLFAGGYAGMVMTGHLFNAKLDPHDPATLSRPVIGGLLRKRLGFAGVVVSDDMQMQAITAQYGFERAVELAVLAGVDVLLFGNNLVYDETVPERATAVIRAMLEDGRIDRKRIERSHERIVRLKSGLRGWRKGACGR